MKTNKRYGISMTYSQNRVKINYSFLKLFGKQLKKFLIHTFHPTQGPCRKAQDHVTKGVSFQGPILLEDWLWRPSSMRWSLLPSPLELGWLVVCLAREGSKRGQNAPSKFGPQEVTWSTTLFLGTLPWSWNNLWLACRSWENNVSHRPVSLIVIPDMHESPN